MSNKKFDIVIIGGGISGLSLASKLAHENKKVLILEAKEEFGGCLKTTYKEESDFWLEMGAHTFYNKYVNVIKLIQENELESDIIAREKTGMKVFTTKTVSILSQINFLELFTNIISSFKKKKEGKNVKEYFSSLLGKGNYDKLFRSLFSAVIVQDADNFSSEFFLKRRKTKNKEFPKSFILEKGMSSLVNKILEHKNIEFATNSEVIEISKEDNYVVKTKNGDEYSASDLALACNPMHASKLMATLNSGLASLLSDFVCNRIITKSYIINKDKLNIDKLSFIIPTENNYCFSMTTRDVKTHSEYRGFSFHLKPSTPQAEQNNIVNALLNGINGEKYLAEQVSHILPRLSSRHREIKKELISEIKKSDVYITGNFFNGLSLEDCVERSEHEFQRYLLNNL